MSLTTKYEPLGGRSSIVVGNHTMYKATQADGSEQLLSDAASAGADASVTEADNPEVTLHIVSRYVHFCMVIIP
jgi:hypothetical protein